MSSKPHTHTKEQQTNFTLTPLMLAHFAAKSTSSNSSYFTFFKSIFLAGVGLCSIQQPFANKYFFLLMNKTHTFNALKTNQGN